MDFSSELVRMNTVLTKKKLIKIRISNWFSLIEGLGEEVPLGHCVTFVGCATCSQCNTCCYHQIYSGNICANHLANPSVNVYQRPFEIN